jgi:hypothetical protein
MKFRGHKVLLDTDLAELYGVATKVLLQAVRRNQERLPEDFMIQLTAAEWAALRSRIVTLESGRGQHRKYLPYAMSVNRPGCSTRFSRRATRANVHVALTSRPTTAHGVE